MDEFIKIVFNCVGIILMTCVTYVVVPAIKDWRQNKLTESQREQLSFWVETGVLWAKQWLQTSTGEQKKAQVMEFVMQKIDELKLPFTEDDVNKAIEAFYNTVKDVTDVATSDAIGDAVPVE